jgi:hypothetical protein
MRRAGSRTGKKPIVKVIGVGLNRTGTKTLRAYCMGWGMQHHTFDLQAFQLYHKGETDRLLDYMEAFDSFEDWPWPLLFREIDARFPDARFVLTLRKDPETWYRSLCNMAVRMGPMNDFEKPIYGYAMPHGHREEHLAFYKAHNEAVREHFKDRPEKLLTVCWETGDDGRTLAAFLGLPAPAEPRMHRNRSARLTVYGGDNLYLAHANRIAYQTVWRIRQGIRRRVRRWRSRGQPAGET